MRRHGYRRRRGAGQGLRDLVLVYLGLDFRAMRLRIGPSVDEVLRTQTRIVDQKLRLACTRVACRDELPNWDPSPGDAGRAAADALGLLDALCTARIKHCNPVGISPRY